METTKDKLTVLEIMTILTPYVLSECKWSLGATIRYKDSPVIYRKPVRMHHSDIMPKLGRPDWIMPVLRPRYNLLEEHWEEALSILHQDPDNRRIVNPPFVTGSFWSKHPIGICFQLYHFLIMKGYAMPVYLGIDHWANNMNPIDLKIALDECKFIVNENKQNTL